MEVRDQSLIEMLNDDGYSLQRLEKPLVKKNSNTYYPADAGGCWLRVSMLRNEASSLGMAV
ncbi:TPA: hypothetical protein ACGCHN_002859 [Stenotrophomonas maltophilia]|uniref:hypothetical protein n=1 Tax=Stenotrophomonas TaxID=40323 RepID=UPI0020969AEA|nr:hypothetical protein [Stenotrophomonas maltophilia]MBN5005312.1 hypothetical protein [Stenotrophomonas maltophilia]MCO7477904.1 hypothetical protein [Stenotrophomonas maltophilia]